MYPMELKSHSYLISIIIHLKNSWAYSLAVGNFTFFLFLPELVFPVHFYFGPRILFWYKILVYLKTLYVSLSNNSLQNMNINKNVNYLFYAHRLIKCLRNWIIIIIIGHNWSKLHFLNFEKLSLNIKSKILLKVYLLMTYWDGTGIFFPELGHVSIEKYYL